MGLIIYIVGIILFYLWDACIGWGYDFEEPGNPHVAVAALLWFISVPILMIHNFIRLCDYLKEARQKRQNRNN